MRQAATSRDVSRSGLKRESVGHDSYSINVLRQCATVDLGAEHAPKAMEARLGAAWSPTNATEKNGKNRVVGNGVLGNGVPGYKINAF